MDEGAMGKVAEELVSLSRRYGQEKFKIPRDAEDAMNFIRKFHYRKEGEFSIDDPRAIAEAERLIGKHRSVLALMNKRDLTYAFYVPSDEGSSRTEGGSSSAYSQPTSGGGCFIATAVYDSPVAPQVMVFRRFRDEVLLASKPGVFLVAVYYLVSPPLASLISRIRFLRAATRCLLLEPVLRLLARKWGA